MDKKKFACEVRTLWGDTVVGLSSLMGVDDFVVGDEEGCDFQMPMSKLGTNRLKLVTIVGGEVTLSVPGRWRTRLSRSGIPVVVESRDVDQLIVLRPGDVAEVGQGDFTFRISTFCNEQVEKMGILSLAGIGFHALSFATHAALLYLCAFSTPTLEDTDDGSLREERRILMTQYLNAAAEKENERQQEAKTDASGSTGQEGSSAKGSEGAMGNPISKPANLRHAVKGPTDNVDPHVARQAAVREAANFGIIGLLNADVGGDPNAPTSPWGRDESSGRDVLSANGKLWGAAVGDAFGVNGLTLSGIGEGGGGPGEGIGIGKEGPGGLGRRGPGGDGIGDGGRRLKDDHMTKTIRMRSGTTTSSGRIPPEIIQRIIRQNFGRFKMCYERGLRGDPNLSGRVAVRFTIGRDGSVTQVANGGSDIPNGEVVGCVVNSFKGLSFPAPESGIVTVGYSISLSPN